MREALDEATGALLPEWTYGCLPPDDESGLLQCKGHLVPHLEPTSIACCADGDLCNRNLRPMYAVTESHPEDTATEGLSALGAAGIDQTTGIALIVSVTVCISKCTKV